MQNVLSLGAGVQSTALLLLSAEGRLPKLDAAIFADTGWEPRAVYDHLQRITAEVAEPAGIPVHVVSVGNIRDDALDPDHAFASLPLFVKHADGSRGMGRRQCTNEYKVRPIKQQVRILLGAKQKANGRPGNPPRGQYVQQWIGISTDEFQRAKDSDVSYIRHVFPLLTMDWSRQLCLDYLREKGWDSVPKSACIGCPFHHDSQWRDLRDHDPEAWNDAVEFDHAIRQGVPLPNNRKTDMQQETYLHSSLLPLDQAPLTRKTREERTGGVQLALSGEEFSCSPFSCAGDEEAVIKALGWEVQD